jgi:cobalt-zinc-cadmium efflux system outer membrane protein
VAAQATTAIDANLAGLDLAATEVAVRDAQLAAAEARRALAALLGLEALPADCVLADDFAAAPDPLPTAERLHELAQQRRLDLRAAQRGLEEAAAELVRQRGRVGRLVDVGAAAEKDGDWTVGPAVQLELPLFDQNQAQVAKAITLVQSRRDLLVAAGLGARKDVGSARARAEASLEAVRLYAEQILARSREALELASESYQTGKTTIVPVLEAQRGLLAARCEHVLRLQQMATALSDLERATGVPREELFTAPPRR